MCVVTLEAKSTRPARLSSTDTFSLRFLSEISLSSVKRIFGVRFFFSACLK